MQVHRLTQRCSHGNLKITRFDKRAEKKIAVLRRGTVQGWASKTGAAYNRLIQSGKQRFPEELSR